MKRMYASCARYLVRAKILIREHILKREHIILWHDVEAMPEQSKRCFSLA
jgi:hypothetical protein